MWRLSRERAFNIDLCVWKIAGVFRRKDLWSVEGDVDVNWGWNADWKIELEIVEKLRETHRSLCQLQNTLQVHLPNPHSPLALLHCHRAKKLISYVNPCQVSVHIVSKSLAFLPYKA
jgi:hypothetical protein